MSNKAKGSSFEKFFGTWLSQNGYWAHVLSDNKNGQPFDIFAAKAGTPYAFDCKECETDRFQLSRMEPNQISAMNRWIETGNDKAYFAIKFCTTYNIYVVPFQILNTERLHDVKSMTEEQIKKVCELWF